MKRNVFLYHILPAGFYVCLILLFLLSLSVSRRHPLILSVAPEEVRSGDLMVISGRNFGDTRSKSRVWLDDAPLSASAVESWSDGEVKVRLPSLSGSGLVFLETPGGKSRGALYILSDRLPDRSTGAFLPGKPYLSRINTSRFRPGELVVLEGDKLGSRRNNSTILVNLTAQSPESVLDAPDEEQFLPVGDPYISSWTDNSVAFFLPERARSGPLYIRTPAGYSNPVSIEVVSPAVAVTADKRNLRLSQKISIRRVGALPGNALILWVPRPVDRPGQILRESRLSSTPLRHDGTLQVFRLDELVSGGEYRVENRYSLELQGIAFRLDRSQVPEGYENLEMMQPWLRDEEDIPVSYFNRTAAAVVLRETNPYQKARLLFDYVLWKMDLDAPGTGSDHTAWLTERTTDSFGFASFFTALNRAAGVPARMVAGIWVPPGAEQGIPHYWSEVFFPGIGWFPVDTAAADGLFGAFLEEGTDSPGGWGRLDSGYVAFSRGEQQGWMFSEKSKRIDFRSYSQQNVFEEWLGNLDSAAIEWDNIAIIDE